MSRSASIYACLVVGLASSLRAQGRADQESNDSANVMVLDYDFTGVYEFARVFLQNGQVYRAELSSTDVTLDVRGVVRSTRPPRIFSFLRSDSPSGTSVVEIYPEEDAEYEIRPLRVASDGVATRLRIYRDVRASHRRSPWRDRPGPLFLCPHSAGYRAVRVVRVRNGLPNSARGTKHPLDLHRATGPPSGA
jgi:hypothetical protein